MQSAETEDRWYVNVGGTPKMMTLDQLVEAFEAGVINAKTLVTEVGGSEWKPLSEVADLGDDEEAPESVAAPAVQQSYAPAPTARAASVAPAQSYPPAVSRAPQSAWPPVAAARPSASFAPQAGSMAPSAPVTLPPNSTMPVVADLSVGLDDDFKPRRSKAPFVMAAAVVLLVGGALGATRLGGGEVTAPVAVPAAAPAPVAVAPTRTETTTPSTPTPAAAPTSDSSSEKSAASDSRLNDDVKSKLKEADKTRADKKKAAKASRKSSGGSRSKSSGSKDVFRKGGNANDPLNSSL